MVFNFYVTEREVETFIRINDDLFLELEFLPSRVSSQGISINLMKDLFRFWWKIPNKASEEIYQNILNSCTRSISSIRPNILTSST